MIATPRRRLIIGIKRRMFINWRHLILGHVIDRLGLVELPIDVNAVANPFGAADEN